MKVLPDYCADVPRLHQSGLIALGSTCCLSTSTPHAEHFPSFFYSLVVLLQVRRLLGGFWMVRVKQKSAETPQNEERAAVRKINEG